jgi:hypothetical protein
LTKSHRLRVLAAFGPALLAAGAVAGSASNAFAATAPAQPVNDAQFATMGGVAPQFLANAETIPHWTFQYTDPENGVTYPITMAGSDPRLNGSTTIPVVIIPLKLNFVAAGQDTSVLNDYFGTDPGYRAVPVNHTFDGNTKVDQTLASPIFSPNGYDSNLGGDQNVQFGDAFMRAQFNKIGSAYHVNLFPSVLPTQTLDVPATKGIAYVRPAGALTGTAEVTWFSTQLQSLMGSLQISAKTLPLFLTDNVLLYQKTYNNCCILGYHGAGMPVGRGAGSANGQGMQPVQTFAYTAYVTPGTYSGFISDYTGTRKAPSPTRGLSDIHALSHEIAEWLDDPFTNNAVQPWRVASAPQYGCTTVLEVGDPVVGIWFGMDGNNDANAYGQWHPEDEVFAQWFGRGGIETALKTTGFSGSPWAPRFTFMGPLTTGISATLAMGFGDYADNC